MQLSGILGLDNEPLVVKLNHIVEMHFPPGEVDYVEVIRSAMSIATAYQRVLEHKAPEHAGDIVENVKSICAWMAANNH